jgi:hypothetical protein
MKVIGIQDRETYVALVTHTELSKGFNKYWSSPEKLADLKVGQELNLGEMYDFSVKIRESVQAMLDAQQKFESAQKTLFGSDHMYESVGCTDDLETQLSYSNAAGGFSTVWGAGIRLWDKNKLEELVDETDKFYEFAKVLLADLPYFGKNTTMNEEQPKNLSEYIRHRGNKWYVVSKKGKTLGKHETEHEALAQLRAIEANKNR